MTATNLLMSFSNSSLSSSHRHTESLQKWITVRDRKTDKRWKSGGMSFAKLKSNSFHFCLILEPRALTPSLTPGDEVISNLAPRPLYQESCSWFKVPPNIRRDILRLAFGDTRLHIYMNRGYPDVPPEPDSKFHCRVVTEPENWGYQRFPVTNESQAELWQWRGSRCHRYPPSVAKAQGPMTHGGSKGPWIDFCRNGGDPDICEAWREDEGPSACNIGVIGWLL